MIDAMLEVMYNNSWLLSRLFGIVKLTDFMEISLIAMPAKLLILSSG